MSITERQDVGEQIGSRASDESPGKGWSAPRLLYAISAVIAIAAIVGNALIWTSWTTVYGTRGSPTSWLWGQFFAGISVPLGIAGLIAAAGFVMSRWEWPSQR